MGRLSSLAMGLLPVRRWGALCAMLVALWLAAFCQPARTQPCPAVRPVRFAPGATSVTIEGGLARGEQDCLSVTAAAGQATTLVLQSVEANAVLQFYPPGWRITSGEAGTEIHGSAYRGAAAGDDATRWAGRLGRSGAQLAVIGTTRGGASYRLTVTIAP